MRRIPLVGKVLLATAAALAGTVVFAAAASAHVGTITIGCSGVTFSYRSFPSGSNTANQTISINGSQVYSGTFTFAGPSGSDTVPITGANGDVVKANAHWTAGGGGHATLTQTLSGCVTPCPHGTSIHIRWHYSGEQSNGSFSSGSWSATTAFTCPDNMVSMGPQAMEGNLQLAPGATLKAGYDFTVPGDNNPVTVTFTNPKVTFNVTCPSGATPSPATITVLMATPQSYTSTNGGNWYPSGDQSSPLVYQGSITVPNACNGGLVSFRNGGTFTTTIS